MTTNYGATSLVAKLVSLKTPDTHTQTDRQPGTLKPNSVNAVRLKNFKGGLRVPPKENS